MISLLLCGLAAAATYYAGRRSLAAGVIAVLAVGYFYGIVRANVLQPYAHFIFDAGVFGLYASVLRQPLPPEERARLRHLSRWVLLLVAWPVLLLAMPAQDPMVQMVGLRGSIFLLPFLLIGARMGSQDIYRVAVGIAVLNLVSFAFGIAEFFIGIEAFYPVSPVTDIIYRSNDVASSRAYRIPGTFSNAASYSGTMVVTLPFLLGAWIQGSASGRERLVIGMGTVAALLGTLLGASRTHFVVLALLLLVSLFSGQLKGPIRFAWLSILGAVGWIVAGEARLQRFTTLGDTSYITERIGWSVNSNFLELALRYPLGNGLGGGGTSMPYFLEHLVRYPEVNGIPMHMENEYARILLELGLPGLMLWVAFIVWLFTRPRSARRDAWRLPRRLVWLMCAIYFGGAFLGTGLFTSIPQSALILLGAGWIAVRPRAPLGAAPAPPPRRPQLHPDLVRAHV